MKKKTLVFLVVVFCCFSFLSEKTEARNLDRAMVSISVDDGEASVLLAQPILTKYGIPATLYIITSRVGTSGYLTWDQQWLLHWKYRWEIGNHTFRHLDLTTLTEAQVISELDEAQADFLQYGFLGQGAFAAPFGAFDSRIVEILKKVGFITSSRQAWTEDSALNFPATFDEWAINVVSVKSGTTYASLKSFIDQAVTITKKGYLVLIFHKFSQNPVSTDQYQVSTALLEQVAKYISTLKVNGKIDPVTVSEGVGKMIYYRGLP